MCLLFRVLSTTTTASENQPLVTKRKSSIKLEKVFITLKCISNSFFPTEREHLWVTASVYMKVNTAFRVKIKSLEQGVKYVQR